MLLHSQTCIYADRSALRCRDHRLPAFLLAKLRNQHLSIFLEHAVFGARSAALGSLARDFIGILVVGCTANNREQRQTNENNRLEKRDANITNEQDRSDSCRVVPRVVLYKFGSEEERDKELSKQERDVTPVAFALIVLMANLPGRRSSAAPSLREILVEALAAEQRAPEDVGSSSSLRN